MKCIILAGGKGSRLSEYTYKIPKPMVKIGKKPILDHIIDYYKFYGVSDFIIAAGYKHKIIKDYYSKKNNKANINVVNTGLETLTGKRIKKPENFFKPNEDFFFNLW